jgi:hypothetical protein
MSSKKVISHFVFQAYDSPWPKFSVQHRKPIGWRHRLLLCRAHPQQGPHVLLFPARQALSARAPAGRAWIGDLHHRLRGCIEGADTRRINGVAHAYAKAAPPSAAFAEHERDYALGQPKADHVGASDDGGTAPRRQHRGYHPRSRDRVGIIQRTRVDQI